MDAAVAARTRPVKYRSTSTSADPILINAGVCASMALWDWLVGLVLFLETPNAALQEESLDTV